MNPDEKRASAERIWREPFFKAFVNEARQRGLSMTERAGTDRDLILAQAWLNVVRDFEDAVRRAAKPPKA